MIRCTGLFALIAMLMLVAACAPDEKPAAARLPPAAVLIAHRVADYDAWKAAFDDDEQARKKASCLGHYLKRGIDAPDRVYVYCLATDTDKLRAFLDSAELADTMKQAGVQGEPEINVMKPIFRDLVPNRKLPGIIVIHAVEDYKRWRAGYDALDDFRRQSGIIGHAITQTLDDPNRLIVYHQAEDVDSLRQFVASAELRDAMQRGGVVGEPDIRFIQVVDFSHYE